MKMKQKLIAGAVALSAMAGFSVPAAYAEVSASVGVANMYYWRGYDLGNGDPALSADVNYSVAGFTVGAWTSSGDATWGTEYDLYAGYAIDLGPVSLGAGYISYNYAEMDVGPGDFAEVYASAGVGPFKVTYYDNVANAEEIGVGYDDYNYVTAELNFEKFGIKYGLHEDDVAHLDLTYKYNDKLSFMIGQIVDDGDIEGLEDDGKFVVSLSLPIE
ncbi:TorF family putative porin [Cellvibrio sp. NN19]|uniref:TorF family putative porin n=1 Tax=Cellvibrio chitinivorans TaxID=3102792 RepID=UPI002B404079|nr:TorF family putative porin [Cellvibrio sp. NN19]